MKKKSKTMAVLFNQSQPTFFSGYTFSVVCIILYTNGPALLQS